jgi:hypothetical protein
LVTPCPEHLAISISFRITVIATTTKDVQTGHCSSWREQIKRSRSSARSGRLKLSMMAQPVSNVADNNAMVSRVCDEENPMEWDLRE